MTTLTTHHNYWLHTQDKNHHESQLNNRFLYLTGSNFGLISPESSSLAGVLEHIHDAPATWAAAQLLSLRYLRARAWWWCRRFFAAFVEAGSQQVPRKTPRFRGSG